MTDAFENDVSAVTAGEFANMLDAGFGRGHLGEIDGFVGAKLSGHFETGRGTVSKGPDKLAPTKPSISPNCLAISRRCVGPPMTMTREAPADLATARAAMPTGPAPCTTTMSCQSMPVRSTPWMAVISAQPAPITLSVARSSGILKMLAPGRR